MEEKAVLTFVGDVFYPVDTGKRFKAQNIVYNQECVIASGDTLCPAPEKVNLKTDEDTASVLFDKCENRYACIANNHIMDYGKDGFKETVMHLMQNHVFCFGEYLDEVFVSTLDGVHFSLLAYYMTAFCKEDEIRNKIKGIEQDIKVAKEKGAQKIIVSFHFGNEHYPTSSVQQQKIAKATIDLGADLIIGHHPHCIQEKELYKGKWIYYSLGNLAFSNFEEDAYFDENRVSQCKFIWKNTSWTQKSLVVNYDLKTDELSENIVLWKNEFIKKSLWKNPKKKHAHLNSLIGEMRKVWLLLYWNIFSNGRFFYWKGFHYKIRQILQSKRFASRGKLR